MSKYLRIQLAVCCSIIGIVALANIVCDPFLLWGGGLVKFKRRYFFDERLIKTQLIMNEPNKYNGLIVGSSRSSFIHASDFKQRRYFNYAVSSVYPREYLGFLSVAHQYQPFETVLLGLDFFGGSIHESRASQPEPAEYYYKIGKSHVEKLKALLSLDGARYALKNFQVSRFPIIEYYDENLEKGSKVFRSPADGKRELEWNIAHFRDNIYKPYEYNTNLPSIYSSIKTTYPQVRVIPFTTPISTPIFEQLVKTGRLPEYERWLKDAVEAFGTVYDFMGVNSVTRCLDNYVDGHHFHPNIGAYIAARIEDRSDEVPPDFGVPVTASNFTTHIASIREQASKIPPALDCH